VTELQQSRYDRLLRRVGDLKGAGSKVNDVLEELFPVIEVEGVPGELLRLMGTRLGMGGHVLSAVAAQFAKIQIFNPVDSGYLTTVTNIISSTDVAGVITEYFLTTVPLLTEVGNNPLRDTRDPIAAGATTQIRSEQDVSGIPAHFQFRSIANTPTKITDPNGVVILAPGTGLTVAPSTVNRSLTCSFFWRERIFEPSELL